MKKTLTIIVVFVLAHQLYAQNVGIGIVTPSDKLHVSGGRIRLEENTYPWLSFVNNGTLQGFVGAEGVNVRVGTWPGNLTGNLYLRTNGVDRLTVAPAGNIGIGTFAPDTKLHISAGTDVTAAGGGYLQLGVTNSLNVAFDNNEIQARNNGTAAALYFQSDGGALWLGTKITITPASQLYRNLPLSTNADLLPIAYGKVNTGGTVLSGTGNFYVQHLSNGNYKLVLTAEANVYVNRDNYVMIISPVTSFGHYMAGWDIDTDGGFIIQTTKPHVNYTNPACATPCFTSLIQNAGFWSEEDCGFSFMIYKE